MEKNLLFMISECEEIFLRMQEELRNCENHSLLKQVETSYAVVLKYWNQLKQRLVLEEFETVEDEILFFKKCKPRFISELIYYELVYHAETFMPGDVRPRQRFLALEKNRFARFIKANYRFYLYHKYGKSNLDEIYFTRAFVAVSSGLLQNPPYDDHPRVTTSHDRLVATIIAFERFEIYLEQKIRAAWQCNYVKGSRILYPLTNQIKEV